MTKIGFDGQSFGYIPRDNEGADVCGPGAANAFQPMVRRKFIGKTSGKVVRLADIYRVPPLVRRLAAKDINPADGIKRRPDGVMLKFVGGPARSRPD